MSYKSYFFFAAGINQTIKVSKGTKKWVEDNIQQTEQDLNIEREQYLDNPIRWKYSHYKDIKDKVLCETAQRHNDFIKRFYDHMSECSNKPPIEFEEITPDEFKEYLIGLNTIDVKPERWTGEYYTEQMQLMYEVMRGRGEDEGIYLDAPKLSIKQAGAVIRLLSEFLDNDDRRLDVPKGQDYLASSYDGGYEWCEQCGAITWDDSLYCKKRKCPLIKERKENENY